MFHVHISPQGMSAVAPAFPFSHGFLRESDFADARALFARVSAEIGEEGVFLGGCPLAEVCLPSRWRGGASELSARLDDSSAAHALSADISNAAVQLSAQAYLKAFFNKATLSWLCIAKGLATTATFPASTKAGMSMFVHAPPVSQMLELLKDVRLVDIRVVLCFAWLGLAHLNLVSPIGLPVSSPPPSPPAAERPVDIDVVLAQLDAERSANAELRLTSAMALERALAAEARVEAARRLPAPDPVGVATAAAVTMSTADGALPALPPDSVSASTPEGLGPDPSLASVLLLMHKSYSEKREEALLRYSCPKDLFLIAVRRWIKLGTFVDPHLLAPRYLESLKTAAPVANAHKVVYDPFLKFADRDHSSWGDGCHMLELLWCELDSHKHLRGTFASLRGYLCEDPYMTDAAAIEITKRLMKDFPDPLRIVSWQAEFAKDFRRNASVMVASQISSALDSFSAHSRKRGADAPAAAPGLGRGRTNRRRGKGKGGRGAGGWFKEQAYS